MSARRRSIHGAVLIRIAAVFAVVYASLAAITYSTVTHELQQAQVEEGRRSLAFAVQNLQSNYNAQLRTLDVVTGLAPIQRLQSDEGGRLVERFLEFSPWFESVHLYRRSGETVLARRRDWPGPYHVKRNFHDKDPRFIRLAETILAGKTERALDTFETDSGELYQVYVVPVRAPGGGAPVAVLSGAVFPSRQNVNRLVEGLRLSNENFFVLSDGDGRILASAGYLPPPETRAWWTEFVKMTPPSYQKVADTLLPGRPGRDILVAQAVPELNLTAALAMNEAGMLRRLQGVKNILLAIFGATLVVAALSAAWLGSLIARPFQELTDALRQILAGRGGVRLNEERKDEVGETARMVNRLAAKLERERVVGEFWSAEPEEKGLRR